MFSKVNGFFHKSVEGGRNHNENLLQQPVIFDNNSKTVLVEMDPRTYKILFSLFNELERADRKYKDDPMMEPKVAVKTIECERSELDRECQRSAPRPDAMRKEAVQVMTMGYKFVRDICDNPGEY